LGLEIKDFVEDFSNKYRWNAVKHLWKKTEKIFQKRLDKKRLRCYNRDADNRFGEFRLNNHR
jgi:hypothetical protein